MAKRRRAKRREPAATIDYPDVEGNVLSLRQELSAGTISQIQHGPATAAASSEDAWRRRTELLFERLAVGWEIAGLPLTDQSLLLGRYRMADAETKRWVARTIADHVRAHIPELDDA